MNLNKYYNQLTFAAENSVKIILTLFLIYLINSEMKPWKSDLIFVLMEIHLLFIHRSSSGHQGFSLMSRLL